MRVYIFSKGLAFHNKIRNDFPNITLSQNISVLRSDLFEHLYWPQSSMSPVGPFIEIIAQL